MTRRNPHSFGRRKIDRPKRFGHEQFSFFAMLAAITCTAWAVMTYEGFAFVCAIVFYALATLTLPEGH